MVSEPQLVEKEQKVIKKLKVGEKFSARVIRVEPFGLFVKVDSKKWGVQLEGLVHISEVSWEKVEDLPSQFKVGDKVKVVLLNKNEGKLQFSLKRLTPDPWEGITKRYPKDVPHKGVVTKVTNFGALVRLEPGVEGLIHISKIPPNTKLKEGQQVRCFVENIDEENRRLSLELDLTKKPAIYR